MNSSYCLALQTRRLDSRQAHHSSRGGGEDLSDGARVLVGEQVDGGQGPVDYHSQDKDDHQADLDMINQLITIELCKLSRLSFRQI